MSTERILDRVRKMLALANDSAATEGERDNAMRMAHATLAKYNLELAQVESRDKKPVQGEERKEHPVTFYGRPWARRICYAIGQMLFCEYVYVSATKAKDTRHYFVGRYSNAVSAGILSEFLINSVMREGKRRARSINEGNTWFRSFALGAAYTIQRRVDALLADDPDAPPTAAGEAPARAPGPRPAIAAPPGTAIALAGLYVSERAANKTFVAIRWPRMRPGRSGKSSGIASAANEGMQYGSTVSLNHQIGSKS